MHIYTIRVLLNLGLHYISTYSISASDSRTSISCSKRSMRCSISSFSFCTSSTRRRSSSLCRRSSCSCRQISEEFSNGITLGLFVAVVRNAAPLGSLLAVPLLVAPTPAVPTAVPAAAGDGRNCMVCTVPTWPRSGVAGLGTLAPCKASFTKCCCSSRLLVFSNEREGSFNWRKKELEGVFQRGTKSELTCLDCNCRILTSLVPSAN